MKQILLYVFAAVVLIGTMGCSRQEADLFDQSAAERLHATEDALRDNLCSARNGWELCYFPYPDAAGYAFLMKFEADGSVKIAAKNRISTKDNYMEETSLWDIDGTQGCILTFNSYNTLFSVFSDPLSDGVGYSGDYEFVVLTSEDKDHIRLKGKKNQAYISLNKLETGVIWKEYFDMIDDYNADIFDDNDGVDMLFWDGASQIKMTYEDGMFTYEKDGEEQSRGFIITPTGVHFYSGFLMADSVTYAKDFKLTEDKQLLKTDDGKAFLSSSYTAADFFAHKFTTYSRWAYVAEDTDAKTKADFEAIRQLGLAKGADINGVAYERTTTTDSRGAKTFAYALYISYLVDGKVFGGRIVLNHKNANEQLTFSYKSHEDALKPLFARLAATETDAAKLFCDIFCGTYKPESYTGSALNMTQLLLQGENRTIHVIADKMIY